MTFFAHNGGERPGYPAPARVYGRVDHTSTDRADSATVFDVVDADRYDTLDGETALLLSPDLFEEAATRVSAVVVRNRKTNKSDEGRYAEIRLSDVADPADATADHFQTLTSPATPRRVESLTWKTGTDSTRLAAGGRIAALREAPRGEIENAIDVPIADAVAVYDVGQGSSCALIADGLPRAYVDVGGGCLANAATFPDALAGFCSCAQPPIILTHFHQDHWAAVVRFQELLGSVWIVPRQGPSLGFAHAVLCGGIRRHGTLLIWPDAEDRIASAAMTVLRCGGTSRNDSGLAVVVNGPSDAQILVPGDARYNLIHHCPPRVRSLVAAHHGGRTNATAAQIPTPDGKVPSRLAFSFGPGNTYHHPLPLPVERHRQVWGRAARRDTARRARQHSLGHIHLYWTASAPDVGAPHGRPDHPQRPVNR